MLSLHACVFVIGNIKSFIWLCLPLLSPVTLFVLKTISMSKSTESKSCNGKHVMWKVALLLISKKKKEKEKRLSNHLTVWLISFTLWCVSLCVSVACRGLRCLASLVCTQSVCDYCPLQASCTVMHLFTKQLHLHRFCQEPLKSQGVCLKTS